MKFITMLIIYQNRGPIARADHYTENDRIYRIRRAKRRSED